MVSENRWYLDLALVAFLTGLVFLVVTIETSGWLRAMLVVPFVTLLPGYALVAFFYPAVGQSATRTFDENESGLQNPLPTKQGVDTVERLVFSVLASIIVVPAITVISNFTPWGIALLPILVGVAAFTLLFTLGALGRRVRLPPERRFVLQPSKTLANLQYTTRRNVFGAGESKIQMFNVALGISILLFATSVGYAALNPPQGEGFSEFYVETGEVTGDTQSMYPSQFDAGETRELPIAVTNQEHEQIQYRLVVLLQRVDGGGGSQAEVREEQQLTQRSFTVDQGETQNISLSISPTMTGSDLRLSLLLYRGDVPSDPSLANAYRSLRLPIDVGTASGSQSLSERPSEGEAAPRAGNAQRPRGS